MLNLGVRYDYYVTINVTADLRTCRRKSSTLRRRPICASSISGHRSIPMHPYESRFVQRCAPPRLRVDARRQQLAPSSVVEWATCYSPHLLRRPCVRASADPYVGVPNDLESERKSRRASLKWPGYNDDLRGRCHCRERRPQKTVFSVIRSRRSLRLTPFSR